MSKKVLIILGIMCLVLSGCGTNEKTKAASSEAEAEDTTDIDKDSRGEKEETPENNSEEKSLKEVMTDLINEDSDSVVENHVEYTGSTHPLAGLYPDRYFELDGNTVSMPVTVQDFADMLGVTFVRIAENGLSQRNIDAGRLVLEDKKGNEYQVEINTSSYMFNHSDDYEDMDVLSGQLLTGFTFSEGCN